MDTIRATVVAFLALSLTGCGAAAVVQKRQAEDNAAKVQITALFVEMNRQCKVELDANDLDPIRGKVELYKQGGSTTPFAMLIDTSTPTEAEKAAIVKWVDARGRCVQIYNAGVSTLPLPPSMALDIQERARAGLVEFNTQAEQAVNYLIAGLYSGELTYGQFAKQRAETGGKVLAAQKQWFAVLDAQDRQNTLVQAQAAQQQLEATVNLVHAVACAKAKGAYAQALCQ